MFKSTVDLLCKIHLKCLKGVKNTSTIFLLLKFGCVINTYTCFSFQNCKSRTSFRSLNPNTFFNVQLVIYDCYTLLIHC